METIVTELQNRVHLLETKMLRMDRAMIKMKKDLLPETEKKPRPPSGFAKPTPLSVEMCEFLGIPMGSELARTEVTKRVLAYVKEHGLQNKDNKRVIEVDAKLNTLLKPLDNEQVTYFSIQRLLKVHYPPKIVAETEPVAGSTKTPDANKASAKKTETVLSVKTTPTVKATTAKSRAKK